MSKEKTKEKPKTSESSEKQEKPVVAEAPKKPETPGNPESSEPPAVPEKPSSAEAMDDKPAEPDWKALYAITLADFDNYKKRAARDREDTYRFAEADILKDVLPAVDNLALALDNAKDRAEEPFVKGVSLVYDSLLKSLKDHGAEPFDSVGKPLDTEKMEAVAQLPNADFDEGLVSNEVKRGWMLKDKVLRVAQVVVSAGKPEAKNG